MNNDLKTVFQIQKILKDCGYYDISRGAKEVLDYSNNKHISIDKILSRIKNNEPWEYIKGSGEFKGNTFSLDSSTLIPRIETEYLVDYAIKELSNNSYTSVVDVGTGSGCIIISLVKELGEDRYKYIATDTSKDALSIAKQNETSILGKNIINWINTDLIKDVEIRNDVLILANLPYIPTPQYLKLDDSVKNFEPRTALDGGENGIKYYEELLKQIKDKKLKGKAIFEIEPSTLSYFEDQNPLILKDQYERDRFILISFN